MNGTEDIVRKRYEALGYTVVHCGPPDFLIFKVNKDWGTMTDIEFIEVKNKKFPFLTLEQQIWRCALETVGCLYKIENEKELYQKDWLHSSYIRIDGHLIEKKILLNAIEDMNKKYGAVPSINAEWDVVALVEDYKRGKSGKNSVLKEWYKRNNIHWRKDRDGMSFSKVQHRVYDKTPALTIHIRDARLNFPEEYKQSTANEGGGMVNG